MLLFWKVLLTEFIAEMGDKTQLTAITFGANEGMEAALIVWLACSIGLFAADIIGMLVGYLLKNKMPEGVLNSVAFCIFFVFGILTLREGLEMLLGAGNVWVIGTTVAAAVIFAIVCLGLYRKKKAV